MYCIYICITISHQQWIVVIQHKLFRSLLWLVDVPLSLHPASQDTSCRTPCGLLPMFLLGGFSPSPKKKQARWSVSQQTSQSFSWEATDFLQISSSLTMSIFVRSVISFSLLVRAPLLLLTSFLESRISSITAGYNTLLWLLSHQWIALVVESSMMVILC